jgi:glycosyltransferase involved in cell wall biosynthesis
MKAGTNIDLSIIIPMRNEEENVEPLLAELAQTLAAQPNQAEIIIIDDASTDGTRAKLLAAASHEPRLRILGVKQNLGQTVALRIGIDKAVGHTIVMLDGDGQNVPADILNLLDHMRRTDADMVVGWRKQRQDRFLAKRLPSILANNLIRLVTGTPIHDTGCTLKAMKSSLAKQLPLPTGMHRFLPALARNLFRATVVEVEVDHRPRLNGHSKYGWSRVLPVLRDTAIVGRLSFPGWLITRLAEFLLLYFVAHHLFRLDPWASAAAAIFAGAVISFFCWRRLYLLPSVAVDFDSRQ